MLWKALAVLALAVIVATIAIVGVGAQPTDTNDAAEAAADNAAAMAASGASGDESAAAAAPIGVVPDGMLPDGGQVVFNKGEPTWQPTCRRPDAYPPVSGDDAAFESKVEYLYETCIRLQQTRAIEMLAEEVGHGGQSQIDAYRLMDKSFGIPILAQQPHAAPSPSHGQR